MKLVDLDEVINAIYFTDWYRLFNGKLSEGAEDEKHALYLATDIYKAIEEVPVVDAIPIEWIKEYIRTHPASTDIYFKWMIDEWKAEQEKQNEKRNNSQKYVAT